MLLLTAETLKNASESMKTCLEKFYLLWALVHINYVWELRPELRTWTKKTTFFASFFVSFCSSFDNHKTYVLFVPFRFKLRHFLPQFCHINNRYVSAKLIISVFCRVQESNVPCIGVRRQRVPDSNKKWDNFHSTFKKMAILVVLNDVWFVPR